MKKYKEIHFGLLVLMGILLAGCNTQQDVANEPNDIKQGVYKDDHVPAEELPNNDLEQNLKGIYSEKLSKAKQQAEALQAEDDTTVGLRKMESDRLNIWDELLNEIYGDLKEILSEDEMDVLRTEQRDWINERDSQALAASLEYEGGTMEPLVYIAVLANVTEQRCYELVENYIK
ncbi:lysozyme inhibitor LprI family protein [Solibacillus sp.]|uniref:lysozyme inhibitor LprI family protein n=1 Tax=Solibacillus sp. TaxID=1909654 RepID=UPI003314A577